MKVLIKAQSDIATTKVNRPWFSVIIPLFNKEATIERALRSVLNQTLQDFEIVVVNDGSTDNGPEIVRSFNDHRITMIDQQNAGVSVARNKGIESSKYDLIAFLDADDEWKPSFLETISNLRNKFPTCKVFATNYIYCEENGACRFPIIRGVSTHPWEGILTDYFAIAEKSDPPLWTSAVVVEKKALKSVGMFAKGVSAGEDLLVWVKLALDCKIAYSTQPNAIFNIPKSIYDRPGRYQNKTNYVGKEMVRLLDKATPDKRKSFEKYIALWHKNRAVTFLKLAEHQKAMQELRLMAKFSEKTIKWYIYALLTVMPRRITRYMLRGLGTIWSLRRAIK
jgi:glycosyltransferase involved in cell wall biosynthesis